MRHIDKVGIILVPLFLVFFRGPTLLTKAFANAGFVELAKSNLTPPYSLSPKEHLMLADSQDNPSRAIGYFKRAPLFDDISVAYGLGLAYEARGVYSQAAEEFSWVRASRLALGALHLGFVLELNGQHFSALKAWQASPEAVSGLRQQARSALDRGLLSRATPIFTWITEISPDSIESWLDLAEAYYALSDWQSVSNIYDRIAVLAPQDPELSLRRAGLIFRLEGNPASARQIVESALPRLRVINSFEDEFRLYNAYVFLEKLSLAQGRFDEAIEWDKQALSLPRISPRYSKARIALVYQEKGDTEQAKIWMTQAVNEAPGDYSMYLELGNLLLLQDDKQGALHAFEQATKLAPDVIGPHIALAGVLVQTGDVKTAADEYRKVLILDPQNVQALEGLSRK